MHRKPLLSLLHAYQKKHPEELASIRPFIEFVQNNKNCFERSLTIGHVTGSAWLLSPDRSKVLLTHHKKLNKWLQLGGHADGESDIRSLALREAYEESALECIIPLSEKIFDLDIHRIPENRNEVAHFHYDVRFLLEARNSEKISISSESHDLSWIPMSRLEEKSHEASMLRMRRKYLEIKPPSVNDRPRSS